MILHSTSLTKTYRELGVCILLLPAFPLYRGTAFFGPRIAWIPHSVTTVRAAPGIRALPLLIAWSANLDEAMNGVLGRTSELVLILHNEIEISRQRLRAIIILKNAWQRL